ncbi:MAG TPA: polysaccharide biosynthesis/export family protein [Pyrinomonadaceae bacterium]|nr:polysaccharide biosynthesis/export family protein [Pyrinomonadaceae bacterium]
MKKVLLVLAIALAFSVQAIQARAQTNNIAPASDDKQQKSSKVEGETNLKDKKNRKRENQTSPSTTASATPLTATTGTDSAATSDAPAKTLTSVPSGSTNPTVAATAVEEPKTNLTPAALPPTSIYRVGIGDVLDIRLLNAQNRESTLFSVMAGGLLEYPLAGEPLPVAGLTTDEIDARLTAQIKVFENPQVVVSVREYASHTVIVTGLVNDPGTKVLRREAMPLYVVLAEAQLKPEAGRATIMRADGQSLEVNLTDPKATTTLVLPGDVVTLTTPPPAPPQFFYIGGQVNSPGQKDFHQGLTLTQAVLASGGATRFAGSKVKVSRQGSDGKLVVTEHNLKQIEGGKIPDPVLQPGDRLEVGRGSW